LAAAPGSGTLDAEDALRRCAQLIARWRSLPAGSDRSVAPVRWIFGTTRARYGLAGANTPW
jgi:hypothetical protein